MKGLEDLELWVMDRKIYVGYRDSETHKAVESKEITHYMLNTVGNLVCGTPGNKVTLPFGNGSLKWLRGK